MTRRSAVVLGGSLVGLLAASVLSEHVDEVTVVERDRLPDGPASRTGVPQSQHAHLLLSGGMTALETLLPGVVDRLSAVGAVSLGVPNDLVVLTHQGWFPRSARRQSVLSCSRGLLESVVRERVLREERIRVVEATDAENLCGDRDRVTGAIVRGRGSGQRRRLNAEIVVDATGASSRVAGWLEELGAPSPTEQVIDSGLSLSSRLYLAPPGVQDRFPAVFLRPEPLSGQPSRAGSILPIEKGQWLVTLAGTPGAEPATDVGGFEPFAARMRHPLLAELLAEADAGSGVRGWRANFNRRRAFTALPDGFVVVGDAATTTNPLYAQGMSLGAQSVVALRAGLRRRGARGSMRLQREITRATEPGWQLATRQDVMLRGTVDSHTRSLVLEHRVTNRLQRLAAEDPEVLTAFLAEHTLSGPRMRTRTPGTLLKVLRGAPALPSGDAPLTEAELAGLRAQGRRSA